jgi:hypothetical protein
MLKHHEYGFCDDQDLNAVGVLAAAVRTGSFTVPCKSLNISQVGVSRATNSVASLKAKGDCYRSRIAAAIEGLRRLQSAAEIGRGAAYDLAKRGRESRRRAVAYRQTNLGNVQRLVFQKLLGHADALNHEPFMRGLASR